MALKLDKELDSGVVCNYHRIDNCLSTGSTLHISLHLYLDKETREEGKQPVHVCGFVIEMEDESSMNPTEYAYKKLKRLPEYSGAIDV